jgi:hypothetical protein
VHIDAGDQQLQFRLRLRSSAAVEVAAAEKRGRYFGKVFDRDVEFETSTG